jgi:hypothetical protein
MGKMPTVKRFLLAACAALVLAAPAVAAPKTTTTTTNDAGAPATVACRNKIINEWEGTGKIKTTYPLACYHLALTYVSSHADLTEYSSLGDDIKLALQAALQRSHGKKVPAKVGKHYGGGSGGATGGSTTTTGGGGTGGSGNGGTDTTGTPTLNGSTPVATPVADSGSSTPLPLLILGGVALALIAAGAIGTGVRYTRRRNS